ncbi:MAG: hypothetical protein ACI9A2_004087, partial [Halioglobus sp.]
HALGSELFFRLIRLSRISSIYPAEIIYFRLKV